MDAFRRRSTPFLHSSLVIEILELPRSFHGGIVDESSVPNLYRGNRSNSFFTKYEGYGGRKNFHPYFSHEKFHFYLLREKKNIPMANNCRRHWQLFSPENPIDRNTLKRAPWTDSSLHNFFVPFSILYFIHLKKKKKEKNLASNARELASPFETKPFIGLSGSNYAVVISAPSSTMNNTFPRKLFTTDRGQSR